jgi:hypothetical protein
MPNLDNYSPGITSSAGSIGRDQVDDWDVLPYYCVKDYMVSTVLGNRKQFLGLRRAFDGHSSHLAALDRLKLSASNTIY